MEEVIKIALIYGSTRKGRFCDTVASWAASQITQDKRFELKIVDPAASSNGQVHCRAKRLLPRNR